MVLSIHQSFSIRDKRESKCADRFQSLMTSSVKEMSFSMLVYLPLTLVSISTHHLIQWEPSQSLTMMVRLAIRKILLTPSSIASTSYLYNTHLQLLLFLLTTLLTMSMSKVICGSIFTLMDKREKVVNVWSQ